MKPVPRQQADVTMCRHTGRLRHVRLFRRNSTFTSARPSAQSSDLGRSSQSIDGFDGLPRQSFCKLRLLQEL